MEKNVMRSLEQVAKERMEVAVRFWTCLITLQCGLLTKPTATIVDMG